MNVLLLQIDGKIPNVALLRIAAHHKAIGNNVSLVRGHNIPRLFDQRPDKIYASAIFERSKPLVDLLLHERPDAIVGGTGVSLSTRLEDFGITTNEQDYSMYPSFRQSIGFTQRGCRLKCSFCVVPRKEGAVTAERSINEIWRGEGHPKEILLLDNDFFGQADWEGRVDEIRDGEFKVSFNQGINARFLTDEAAEAIASIDYRDDSMKTKRIYTAWDNAKDEQRLFAGLNRLVKYGVKPAHIMVYMLCGFQIGETDEDLNDRRQKLRDFGALPYPMPFVRTPRLVGFQRYVIGSYDKRIGWADWKRANYDPHKLGLLPEQQVGNLFDQLS